MYINANHLIKKNNNNEPLLYETLKYLSKEDFNKINNCEIIQCKHCGNNDSDYYRKSGIVHGKQRYYCKKCKKHFSIKNNQFFLDLIKSYAIYMHINNCGLRSIGRVLGVSFQLVAYWIKTGKDKIEKVKKEMIKKEDDKSIYNKKRNIRVLEMDEARSRSCASSLAAANLLVGEVPDERSEDELFTFIKKLKNKEGKSYLDKRVWTAVDLHFVQLALR